MMNNKRTLRYVAVAVLSLGTLFSVGVLAGWISLGDDYSITRRVVGIPYEAALAEFCEVLEGLDGVTGVNYSEFDSITGTALVTVHYNPALTSTKILMVWLGNTKSIWEKPVIA
ncbi:MAG: hypothetical protein KDD67_13360 [Ignavibacteriae bacterium]|nr:hypothetical protein [Ignavibacteriota bacterium]MCB9217086.1 hypothetical protein [Ignavibacteria bacterium]